MANTYTYLPTEMQDADGNVVYPHTSANIVWTQENENVEEVLKRKMELVVSSGPIPVEQREAGKMYAFIESETAAMERSAAMASPAVGYRTI